MTTKSVLVEIFWIPASEGGRQSGSPPVGTTYAPNAQFPGQSDKLWSIIFTTLVVNADGSSLVKLRFVNPSSPQELLHKGNVIIISEGPIKVAQGIVKSDVDLGSEISL